MPKQFALTYGTVLQHAHAVARMHMFINLHQQKFRQLARLIILRVISNGQVQIERCMHRVWWQKARVRPPILGLHTSVCQ